MIRRSPHILFSFSISIRTVLSSLSFEDMIESRETGTVLILLRTWISFHIFIIGWLSYVVMFGILLIFSFILHCNTCWNCLIPVVKCLCPRQQQLVPLYSLYVFVGKADICYKWLFLVMEGIILFILLHFVK